MTHHLKKHLLQNFLMLKAKTYYIKKFSSKGVILEREVLIDELTHLKFSEKFVSRGWEGLLTKLISLSEEVDASSMACGVEGPAGSDLPSKDEDDEYSDGKAADNISSGSDDSD
ncbi:hypothetical protein CJ030_MR8G003114 [Morella rubra]|uniref:Uncharacterized protein n=1 Tax=Morella rubra TaxID=262757 RepID=A0A6A1USU5_9ROSI|nr:hypothetical protein CJ030_MR8G003114 [Morella rubra]